MYDKIVFVSYKFMLYFQTGTPAKTIHFKILFEKSKLITTFILSIMYWANNLSQLLPFELLEKDVKYVQN